MGQQLEDKLSNPTVPATVLHGSILLAAMTECEDLPADPDYRIQVRLSGNSNVGMTIQSDQEGILDLKVFFS